MAAKHEVVEENTPAAQVFGKQVGAEDQRDPSIALTLATRGTWVCSPMVFHIKQTNQERQNYRAVCEQFDELDYQSFSCLISYFPGSFEQSRHRSSCFGGICIWS
jgi:hypothetical protein